MALTCKSVRPEDEMKEAVASIVEDDSATPDEVKEAVASLVDSGELSEDEGAEVLRQVFAKEEDGNGKDSAGK